MSKHEVFLSQSEEVKGPDLRYRKREWLRLLIVTHALVGG